MMGLGSAAVMSGIFTHDTSANVKDAITLEHYASSVDMYGGETVSDIIVVTNHASIMIPGDLKTTYTEDGRGLETQYSMYGVELTDTDGDGKINIEIPANTEVNLVKKITAATNIVSGNYVITTEMKAE